mgnify:CR=1 FL=1
MPDNPADIANLNRRNGALIVEELVRQGVDFFCLSPGSRSTPLALAVAEHPHVRNVVHADERGAAYCALGWARAEGRPAALICTSGTAAANYLPAVVEASMSGIPLIVLTADRPPELMDTGSNQTIRQAGLYGPYVRWEFPLPCSDAGVPPEAILTSIAQAVCRATHAPAGPVHLNCAFREPLMPAVPPDSSALDFTCPALRGWMQGRVPYTTYAAPERSPDTRTHQAILHRVTQTARGLLILGRFQRAGDADAALALAHALNWPVFADITSGLRLGTPDPPFVPYGDLLLSLPEIQAFCRPEIVLHIGGQPTSKRLAQHWETYPPGLYWMVAEHPFRHDPHGRVTQRLEADVAPFCEWLAACVEPVPSGGWLDPWAQWAGAANTAIDACLAASDALSEPEIARLVSRHIASGGALFLGNSMPVRDMDLFAVPDGPRVPVMSNRGASGIDGCIAAAAGFSLGTDTLVTAILGDLAVLHDLNSLSLLKRARVILVAINNDGGGIFSFLPVSAYTHHFETFFAAPHGLRFDSAAAMFRLPYHEVRDRAEFIETYRKFQAQGASAIIEVRSSRAENLLRHQALRAAVVSAVAGITPPDIRA